MTSAGLVAWNFQHPCFVYSYTRMFLVDLWLERGLGRTSERREHSRALASNGRDCCIFTLSSLSEAAIPNPEGLGGEWIHAGQEHWPTVNWKQTAGGVVAVVSRIKIIERGHLSGKNCVWEPWFHQPHMRWGRAGKAEELTTVDRSLPGHWAWFFQWPLRQPPGSPGAHAGTEPAPPTPGRQVCALSLLSVTICGR